MTMKSKFRNALAAIIAGTLAATFSACTDSRHSIPVGAMDAGMLARYEAKTSVSQKRVSGKGECESYLMPFSKDIDYDTYGDSGTLFSGLSHVEALALRAAIADACKNAGADVLIGVQYKMTTTSFYFFYEYATCEASGFPAKIEHIKQIPISTENFLISR